MLGQQWAQVHRNRNLLLSMPPVPVLHAQASPPGKKEMLMRFLPLPPTPSPSTSTAPIGLHPHQSLIIFSSNLFRWIIIQVTKRRTICPHSYYQMMATFLHLGTTLLLLLQQNRSQNFLSQSNEGERRFAATKDAINTFRIMECVWDTVQPSRRAVMRGVPSMSLVQEYAGHTVQSSSFVGTRDVPTK